MSITPQDVRSLRTKNHYSIETFAKMAGVAPMTIDKYEKGKTKKLKQDTLNKFVNLFNKLEKNEKQKKIVKNGSTALKEKRAKTETQTIKALVAYTTYAEVEINVEEEILETAPLTTKRTYGSPENIKVVENELTKGKYNIVKIISDNVIREPFPAYTR